MTREQLDRLWNDPRSWTPWAYRCPADPRLIVPKRQPWAGWTVNFAHPWAWPAVIASVLLSAGPTLLLVLLRRGVPSPVELLVAVALPIALIIIGSIWESTRDRS